MNRDENTAIASLKLSTRQILAVTIPRGPTVRVVPRMSHHKKSGSF